MEQNLDIGRDLPAPADPVARFLAEARRHPRLGETEERALAARFREHGDLDAARKLVLHNLRLVVRIAFDYRRAWSQLLDLLQEGSVGLALAVERWEPTLGARFGTYARHWIRAYVLHFLLVNARQVHVGSTRVGRKLFFRLERERQKLLAAGFEASPRLLAARLDLDEQEVEAAAGHLDSTEVPLESAGTPDGVPLAERIPSADATPEEAAGRLEVARAVEAAMTAFGAGLTDERERAVWREHLVAEEPRPLSALGGRFGISKQRVGQVADRLKGRFREELASRLGGEVELAWLAAG